MLASGSLPKPHPDRAGGTADAGEGGGGGGGGQSDQPRPASPTHHELQRESA